MPGDECRHRLVALDAAALVLPPELVCRVFATVIAVLLLGVIWMWITARRSHSQVAIRSIAVLPLENLSSDPAQDYFADGMTDELITNVGQIGGLLVTCRTSAMQYKGAHKPMPLIARELNVDAVVEGTMMRSGNQIRITVQLIEARADCIVQAEAPSRPIERGAAGPGLLAHVRGGTGTLDLGGLGGYKQPVARTPGRSVR